MRGVARTTRSPAPLLIHVQKVQIRIAVSEVREIRRFSCQHNAFRVTAKAQVVILLAERRIELRRVLLRQETEVIAPVCGMAPFTILLSNRTVQELHILCLSGKRSYRLVPVHLNRLVVARHAEFHRGVFQAMLYGRSVRRMATQTTARLGHSTVFVLRRLRHLLYIFVTRIAQFGRVVNEHPRIIRSVNVVTSHAFPLGRLMDELELLEFILCDFVTGKAEIVGIYAQQILVVRSMRVMTNGALARGNRPVQKLHIFGRFMTFSA
jgi:hypothetical protein